MTYPAIRVEIAFATNPLASPLWVDVTAYVKDIPRIRRGRQSPLTDIEMGEATIILDNRTRIFDPTYASGAYYPNVKPMRRVRISATLPPVGTIYYLFTGYINDWEPAWEASNQDGEITITASDGFIFFNSVTLTGSYPAAYVHDAISTALVAAGWPTGTLWTLLPNGNAWIAAQTLTAKNALQHLMDLTRSDGGLFIIDKRGRAYFQQRRYRYTTAHTGYVFGDGGYSTGEYPYQAITISLDDKEIFNDCRVSPPSGIPATSTDSASQTAYFPRTLTRDIIVADDVFGSTAAVEAQNYADYLKTLYKNPQLRIERLVLDGATASENSAAWPMLLSLDISNKVTIKRRPPPLGSTTIVQDAFIESTEYSIRNVSAATMRFTVTLQLSTTTTKFWILDAILGADTFIGF